MADLSDNNTSPSTSVILTPSHSSFGESSPSYQLEESLRRGLTIAAFDPTILARESSVTAEVTDPSISLRGSPAMDQRPEETDLVDDSGAISDDDFSVTDGEIINLDDELPDAPVYNPRLQEDLTSVKGQLLGLANTLRLSEMTSDTSTNIHALERETRQLSKFTAPQMRSVGFIGDSGVGDYFRRRIAHSSN